MRGPCAVHRASMRCTRRRLRKLRAAQGWLGQDRHGALRSAHELGALLHRQARVGPEACTHRAAGSTQDHRQGRLGTVDAYATPDDTHDTQRQVAGPRLSLGAARTPAPQPPAARQGAALQSQKSAARWRPAQAGAASLRATSRRKRSTGSHRCLEASKLFGKGAPHLCVAVAAAGLKLQARQQLQQLRLIVLARHGRRAVRNASG